MLASLGCTRDNPAFNLDTVADGGTDAGESGATTTSPTTTQSTTQMGDGDGDATGDGDGDGTGDGDGEPDTDTDTPLEDLPVESCEVATNPGAWIRVGVPSDFLNQTCPPSFIGFVRAHSDDGVNWLASPCPQGCYAPCLPEDLVIGVEGIMDNGAALPFRELVPPDPYDPNEQWRGCYWIEAVEQVDKDPNVCSYAALSVFDGHEPSSNMVFHASRDNHGLTGFAIEKFGVWHPPVVDPGLPTCACEELEINCCPGSTVATMAFELGDTILPGDGGGFIFGQASYKFFAVQAQSGVSCSPEPETSWAMLYEGP